MKILLFSGFYLPGYKGGGPIKTIKNLISQTSDSLSYKVITLDRDLGDKSPYDGVNLNDWNEIGGSQVFYISPGIKGLRQIFSIVAKNNYDILYLNSFFSPRFSLVPLIINKLIKKQVVLGPRGEFSKGALSLKSYKKAVYISFFKFLHLEKNIIFQASSKHEKQDIINTIGSDTDIFIAEDIGAQEFAKNISMRHDKIAKAVFISRISPMKNLILALEVLKKVRGPLIYDIYGPIEDKDYWQQCQKAITDLPSHITVQYMGELTPDNVVPTLSLYDFFFMPTKGENYGHVIAEALCAGLPLLISNTTPWRNLESLGIGWDIPLDNVDAFSKIIDKIIDMPDFQHHEMRKNVLNWAQKKFAQRSAIDANIAMFRYAYNKNKGMNNAI